MKLKKEIKGKCIVMGDDVSTDDIIPGRYIRAVTPDKLGEFAFRDSREIKGYDIIVAGKNFGMGSSREQAPIALILAGIKFVVAKSFARIFYRNCIAVGLLPLIGNINPLTGDILIFNPYEKKIRTPKGLWDVKIPDGLPMEILDAGGMIGYLKNNIKGITENTEQKLQ